MRHKILYAFWFIVLFALFVWQTLHATLKYLDKTTITSTSDIDDGTILFPSITVCKKYSQFNLESYLMNKSINVSDKIMRYHNITWSKHEVFYFFSHPHMFDKSFPCTTMEGRGTSPGKPCSFPFINWHGQRQERCESWGDCKTRYGYEMVY